MGDLNSDPFDGASLHDAIDKLLAHGRVDASVRRQYRRDRGSRTQGGANLSQQG